MTGKKSKPLSLTTAKDVRRELERIADAKQAAILSKFFKTGKGEYGEGDVFIGVKVPAQRSVALQSLALPKEEITLLLDDPVHECRLTGALILVAQYHRGDEKTRERLCRFYLSRLRGINNWDLVDLSAPKILGEHLLVKPGDRKILYRLVKSRNLWERRVAVLATYPSIKRGDFTDILALSKLLLNDDHDLMHKAVGWMLREAGKVNLEAEETFLKRHYRDMPRTMLRYAIEKFPKKKRDYYMGK